MPIKFEKSDPLTASNYTSRSYYEAFLYGDAFDIGGGTITQEEIDEIKEYPDLKRISIAGLHQDTFEYFVEHYGKQFSGIYFFKNKMVTDLSALESLEKIEAIGYFLNQRATSLWDVSKNTSLKMLNIDDFSRLDNLVGIEKAPSLKYLEFGNKIWATSKINIVPDMSSSHIQEISFNAELSYENIYELLKIPSLNALHFRSNLCKTEFLAWISANYPELEGFCLKPYFLYRDDKEGFICGKRKPHIDMDKEKDRLKVEKCIRAFNEMKQRYGGMSFEDFMKILDK